MNATTISMVQPAGKPKDFSAALLAPRVKRPRPAEAIIASIASSCAVDEYRVA